MIWDQYKMHRKSQPDPDNYVRVLSGLCIWKDWYRWFIHLFDGRIIWFYQSDVAGFEIVPPYAVLGIGDPAELFPPQRHVRLFVELPATGHPEGVDS